MQMLYNNVCCEPCKNCEHNTNGHYHGIPYDILLKSINKLKTDKNNGYEGLTSDYFHNGTPLLYECISLFVYLYD